MPTHQLLEVGWSTLQTPVFGFIGTGAALIGSALIGTAGAAIAGKLNSNAAKDAGVIQANSADQALKYEQERQTRQDALDAEKQAFDRQQDAQKQQFDREQLRMQQQRRQPFVGAGTNAVSRLNDLLGRSNQNVSGPGQNIMAPVPQPNIANMGYQGVGMGGGMSSTMPLNRVALPSAAPSEPTILMRAPTGEQMPVPQSQVKHYTSLGAEIIQ